MSLTATFKLPLKNHGATSVASRFLGVRLVLIALCTMAIATPGWAATTREYRPQSDAEVIEVLATRTKSQPTTLADAIAQAKIAIQSSRELQDPRYLGRARALLKTWWGKENAPNEVLSLQATIEQSLHLFSDARKTLASLTTKDPDNLQAWLTVASLDRLGGNYGAALTACERASRSTTSDVAKIYGDLCIADIQCHLKNDSSSFRTLLLSLIRLRLNPDLLSWGFSLLAECEERAGESVKSLDAYRSSLALAPDNYTAISYVDALLRSKQPEKASQVLASLPKSDSVLLRLAHSFRLRDFGQWKMIHRDLMQRFDESIARGDDPKLHARERAYAALWLSNDAAQATAQSRLNIESQKEVIDWLLLFESLEQAKDKISLKRYTALLQNTGLRDQRLRAWTVAK
jgi:tetratricopeptide (TPR) repeat protein